MARKPNPVGKTPWATYLRGQRLQTKKPYRPYVGSWCLSMDEYATLISRLIDQPLPPNTYRAWELGRTTPSGEMQARVRKAIEGMA